MKIPGTNGFEEKITSKIGSKKAKKAGRKEENIPEGGKISSQAESAEKVSVSSRAREIAKINEIIKASPDIRAEKVERIKNEIANGSYSVDSKDIAEKILKEILSESFFLK